MGGSDSTTTTGTSTIRFADYIESKHSAFLDEAQAQRIELLPDSPFDEYTNIEVSDAFFGDSYAISSFPSLYDMFGKFVAGLDVEALYTQSLETATESPLINDLVTAESTLLDDDIEANILPRFELGARDINSVMSSSFVIGKSVIEEARVKSIAKFSAQLKYNMIPVSVDLWKTHLTWNQNVIARYVEVMKTYYITKISVDKANYGMASSDKLWPFTVLGYEGKALGALTGAQSESTTETAKEDSSLLSTGLGVASALLGFF